MSWNFIILWNEKTRNRVNNINLILILRIDGELPFEGYALFFDDYQNNLKQYMESEKQLTMDEILNLGS